MKRIIGFISLFMVVWAAEVVLAADSVKEAFEDGTFYADVRLRYEFVDQEGFDQNAHAKTARTRLGFKTDKIHDFVAVIEGENVSYLGNDDYNDTVNGRSDHPTVADPENTQVNQAYGEYTGFEGASIKAGRQVIALDGHRFIGHVGWRQNNQVYDAVTAKYTGLADVIAQYGYIYNVNRIFGEQSVAGDWGSKSHYYNIAHEGLPIGKIIAYGYLLDFGSDAAANSSQTFGGSISGKKAINDHVSLKYHLEYARQEGNAQNATDYHADYYHFAPAIVWKNLTTTIGYEQLGSDKGAFAFRTPLATLHKWNGWADKFLTTPANGLEDFYLDLTYKVKDLEGSWDIFNGLLAKVQYHDFDADSGGRDHGSEWGIYLKQPIGDNVYVEAKYANYDADNTSTDTEKFIFGIGIKY